MALSGCGGGEQARDETEERRSEASVLIEEAARATLAQGTARDHVDFHTEPGRNLAFTADGVVDLKGDDERGTFRYESFEGVEPGT